MGTVRKPKSRPYEVRIGEQFDVDVAEDDPLFQSRFRELARWKLAGIVLSVFAVFLASTAAYGAFYLNGDFSGLQSVWQVLAMPVTCILAFYFQGGGRGNTS